MSFKKICEVRFLKCLDLCWSMQHHPAAYMNNHGGMGPQRGGNDPVSGGHMHQLSSHSPTMGSPESKPVIQASMLAAYQGM